MRTSLDHTKEAALQAALTGVQAVVPPDGVAPSRTAVEPVLAGSRARRKPVAMMDPDRAKLQIAAVVGAVFGILTGYVVGHPPFGILIWGLIGAVVGAGAVYCYRAFR
jgi:uncharacterized membrane protein